MYAMKGEKYLMNKSKEQQMECVQWVKCFKGRSGYRGTQNISCFEVFRALCENARALP